MCSALGLAQSTANPSQPSPELRKLDYFAGNWKLAGELKDSPYGPGGKISSVEHNYWMAGGFFLISDMDEKTPRGPDKGLAIFGYDPDEKKYTYHSVNSFGESEDSRGVLEGDTWIWVNETNVGGKTIKGRFMAKELSHDSYSFKFEMATDGGTWLTIMDGKATKQ